MPNPVTLDSIRERLRKGGLSAAALAELVEQASKISTAAAERLRTRTASLDGNPLASSADRSKDRDAASLARLDAEDADAVLAEAQRQHAEALAANEQDRREAIYAAARAQGEAATSALARIYPKLVREGIALLKTLAEAQQAVKSANEQLPDGAELLPDPEHVARGTPGIPREVVADEWVELWGRSDLNEPVDAAFQQEIESCGAGWGKRAFYEAGSASMGEPQAAYRRRRFRKVTTRDSVSGTFPIPLAASLQLPELRSERMAWGENFPVYNPALSAVLTGGAEPGAVLSRIAEIEAQANAKPVKIDRPLRVEWVSHIDVVPLPSPPPAETTKVHSASHSSRFGASPFTAPGRAAGGR